MQEPQIIDYIKGLLPDGTGASIVNSIEEKANQLLIEFREEAIYEFCEKHNLCPICIKGGWDCSSDHK
jgi:hypothetical protein